MRLTRVIIRNIMGLLHYEFEAGDITEISGRNGEGKTSIVRGIQAALGGGHDATLIRQGEEEGEAVLVFGDDLEARKTIKPSGSSLRVSPKPDKIGSQTYINTLQDGFGLNPVDLLSDEKKRADYILTALNLRVTLDDLQEATTTKEGEELVAIPEDAEERDALAVIDALYKRIYDDRTDSNRDVKKLEGKVEQLRKSLPEGETMTEEAMQEWLDTWAEEIRGLQERIQELQAKRVQMNERMKRLSTDANTRALLKSEQEELKNTRRLSEDRSAALTRLEKLRRETAGKMPFKLSFDDSGGVLVGGIPFDKLNTQAQIALAMQLATLRAKGKEIALVCVDGIERLDSDQQAALIEWAKMNSKRANFIITRVADHELQTRVISADDPKPNPAEAPAEVSVDRTPQGPPRTELF